MPHAFFRSASCQPRVSSWKTNRTCHIFSTPANMADRPFPNRKRRPEIVPNRAEKTPGKTPGLHRHKIFSAKKAPAGAPKPQIMGSQAT